MQFRRTTFSRASLRVLGSLLALVLLLAPAGAGERRRCRFGPGDLATETLPKKAPKGDAIPIDHILVLMQENRSFDFAFR